MFSSRLIGLAAILVLGRPAVPLPADEARAPGRAADQSALKPFAGLVGSWRGVGQPRRGNAKGSWSEDAAWSWRLTSKSAALAFDVEKGKYLKSAELRPVEGSDRFVLDLTFPDGMKRSYEARSPGKPPFVFLAAAAAAAPKPGPDRVTLSPLHETRFTMLLESRDAEAGGFVRIAEVGYTLRGADFAVGSSYPVCVVTEGRGTAEVSYKGKTYWVCCSGCKDLFNDDPEAVLAEAALRKAQKK